MPHQYLNSICILHCSNTGNNSFPNSNSFTWTIPLEEVGNTGIIAWSRVCVHLRSSATESHWVQKIRQSRKTENSLVKELIQNRKSGNPWFSAPDPLKIHKKIFCYWYCSWYTWGSKKYCCKCIPVLNGNKIFWWNECVDLVKNRDYSFGIHTCTPLTSLRRIPRGG